MRNRTLTISATLLALAMPAVLRGAEAKPAPAPVPDKPIVVISVPNVAKTVQNALGSLFGKAWMLPAMANVRDKVNDEIDPEVQGTLNTDVVSLLNSFGKFEFGFFGMAPSDWRPEPRFIAQFTTTMAEQLADRMQSSAVGMVNGNEGAAAENDQPLFFRRGKDIVVGSHMPQVKGFASPTTSADAILTWQSAGVRDAVLAGMKADGEDEKKIAGASVLLGLLPDGQVEVSLRPDGISTTAFFAKRSVFFKAVDTTVLAKAPTDALIVQAYGINGPAWWKQNKVWLLDAMAKAAGEDDVTPKSIEENANKFLTQAHIDGGMDAVMNSLDGTVMTVVGGGGDVMIPSILLAIPRSKVLDDLITKELPAYQAAVPSEGNIELLSFKMPGEAQIVTLGGLALGRDKTHWVISTDSVFAAQYVAGKTGGWTTTDLGKKVLMQGGKDAVLIGGARADRAMRLLVNIMGIAGNAWDQGTHGPALTAMAHYLAMNAGADMVVARPKGEGITVEAVGPMGGAGFFYMGSSMPILAAIAIPNLLESRVVSNEAAAASRLRSGVWPAQLTFQSGAYVDEDQDGVGQYGFIREMDGTDLVPFQEGTTHKLSLLPPNFGVDGGYTYSVFLPDGEGGAMAEPKPGEARKHVAKSDDQEIHWVCYAVPKDAKSGRRVFAIHETGTVYSLRIGEVIPGTEERVTPGWEPKWNSLSSGQTWTDEPTWNMYRR